MSARNLIETLEGRQLLSGDGLSAVYFDNANFTGPSVARVDAAVNFNWGTGAAAVGLGSDTFSARWAGHVQSIEAGTYTFRTTTDDGVRLWVDDKLVLDFWKNQSATARTGTIALAAGRKYHLVMEYYDNTGKASAKLEWKRPGQSAYALIPTANLFSDNRVFPSDGVTSIKSFGAKGDGIADDTVAIQTGLDALKATNKVLYFPSGTYRLTNGVTLGSTIASAKRIIIQGQSRDNVVLKLDDAAAGFTDAAAPKRLFSFYDGTSGTGQAFMNSLYDLTIDAGARNPGVVALRFQNNNQGSISDVTLRARPDSTDANKRKGLTGMDLTSPWVGPAMIRDVLVEGFNTGVKVANYEYSITFENITLQDQLVVGLTNDNNVLNIRNLQSRNSVTAITATGGNGQMVLIDSSLTGGLSTNTAIINKGGLFARNVITASYGTAIDNQAGTQLDVAGPNVVEFSSHAVAGELPHTGKSLNLPVQDAPETPNEDPSLWIRVDGSFADDTAAIQAAINQAATLGRKTVYLAPGNYTVSGTINVTGSVQRIIGLGATITPAASFTTSGMPIFRIADVAAPVFIERIFFAGSGSGFFLFEQATPQTLVLRHLISYSGQAYRSSGTVGTLFIEDACLARWQFNNQTVFARQINPESSTNTDIIANNSTLWIMGVKTEYGQTTIEATGGKVEVLGGLLYPASHIVPTDRPAFVFNEADASATFAVSGANVYTTLIRQTRNGVSADIVRNEVSSARGNTGTVLFSGVAPTNANSLASYSFSSSDSPSGTFTGLTASPASSVGFTNAGYYTDATSGNVSRTADGMNGSLNTGKYYQITLSPDQGKTLNLSYFSFLYSREDANAANAWRLRSSLDNFASDLTSSAMTSLRGSGLPLLAGSTVMNLSNLTAPITFRLYLFGAPNATSDLRIDDLTFYGTVV